MRPHRGVNSSTVAGEGLEGLPGVLIAAFFVVSGLCLLLALFFPDYLQAVGDWAVPICMLVIVGACVVYVLSQMRDRALTAQLGQELHTLNEAGDRGTVPDGSTTLGMETSEALAMEMALASLQYGGKRRSISPEGLLVVVITIFFLWGMASSLLPMEYETVLLGVFVLAEVAGVIGYLFSQRRASRQADQLARALEELNPHRNDYGESEPCALDSTEQIRPR